MPKANVYLSDDLTRAVRDAGVSLSAVCQQALQAEVDRTRLRGRARAGAARVAVRLLAAERETDDRQYRQGFETGTRWAQEAASLRELRRAQRVNAHGEVSLADFPTLFATLVAAGFEDVEPDDVVELEDDAFTAGIIDAAADVYVAALPHLERLARPTRRQQRPRNT